MSEPVPFVALDREHAALAEELDAAFRRVLRRGAFILGDELGRFEAAWAATCGTQHCVARRGAPLGVLPPWPGTFTVPRGRGAGPHGS